MKRLSYLMLLVLGFGFLVLSCEKQVEAIIMEDSPSYKDKKVKEKVRLCHYDDDMGDWHFISISANAVKAHLKHGDYTAFPYVGTFTWNYTAGQTYSHTMTITDIGEGTFSGNGVYNANSAYTWDVTGTYDQKGNVTFTVLYTGAFPGSVFNCTGSVFCGDGTSGSATGTVDGTWYIPAE